MLQGVDKICVWAGGSKHTCWFLPLKWEGREAGRKGEGG